MLDIFPLTFVPDRYPFFDKACSVPCVLCPPPPGSHVNRGYLQVISNDENAIIRYHFNDTKLFKTIENNYSMSVRWI